MIEQLLIHYGKHKIPRYIYHLTNKENWLSILNSGELRTSSDELFGHGVFATELTNFFKRWRNSKDWNSISLQEQLVRHTSKGEEELVILRIPTSNLDHSKLVVRSQNRLFSWVNDGCFSQVEDAVDKVMVKNHEDKGWANKAIKLIQAFFKFPKYSTKEAEHIIHGTPAKNAGLLKQKKEALEYIYADNIPASNIEKIGEVNVNELRHSREYDPIHPIRSIFTALLEGTPEKKGAELLNC